MMPMQIIVAGTQNAAHVCNLDHELGTLEAGKITDVLVWMAIRRRISTLSPRYA